VRVPEFRAGDFTGRKIRFEPPPPLLGALFDDKMEFLYYKGNMRAASYETFICLFLTLRVIFQEKDRKKKKDERIM
jgi:hypothetical protein